MILGVDVGQKGAIALMVLRSVRTGAPELVWTDPMPPLEDLAKELASRAHEIKCAYIEKQSSRPGQSVVAMFSFGQHYGGIIGLLIAAKIPYVLVPPKTWQAHCHQGTDSKLDPKERSLQAARRIFPLQEWRATERCKKPHDGLVDAALIAHYGVKHFRGDLK